MSKLTTIVAACAAILFSTTTFSDFSNNNGLPLDSIPEIEIPELDWAKVFAEDAQRSRKDEAPRFAIPHEVRISPATDGIWERIDRNTMRWSLRIGSENAISLNLGFEHWQLPRSAEMTLGTTDGEFVLRTFTSDDNKPHGELWTPVLPSDEIILEIIVANREQHLVNNGVLLSSINVG
ncbi:MAG: hypothetical protein QF718_08285, partial [Phycisphaerales bacterium]|nr:hypothetical protein [Phycisphaerales bacterium]